MVCIYVFWRGLRCKFRLKGQTNRYKSSSNKQGSQAYIIHLTLHPAFGMQQYILAKAGRAVHTAWYAGCCLHARSSTVVFSVFVKRNSDFTGTEAAASCGIRSCTPRHRAARVRQADHNWQEGCCQVSRGRAHSWDLQPLWWRLQRTGWLFSSSSLQAELPFNNQMQHGSHNSWTGNHISTADNPLTAPESQSGHSEVMAYYQGMAKKKKKS